MPSTKTYLTLAGVGLVSYYAYRSHYNMDRTPNRRPNSNITSTPNSNNTTNSNYSQQAQKH